MHPRPSALLVTVLLSGSVAAAPLTAQWTTQSAAYQAYDAAYSDDALDELLSRIALYPDALLADMLVAATYPEQVDDAQRHLRQYGMALLDDEPWDVSVKAVAHYPTALGLLAASDDWRVELGRAYISNPELVMASVQRLRARAANLGNLRSTPEHVVSTDFGNYLITPADPRTLYVPTYDADVIYRRPIFTSFSAGARRSNFWSFGAGFLIGSWLSYDCDWRGRRVYYDGWSSDFRPAGGWRHRARPFIQITNVYVHPRYRTIIVNRDVMRGRSRYVYRSRGRGWGAPRYVDAWGRDGRRHDRDWRRDARDDRRDDRRESRDGRRDDRDSRRDQRDDQRDSRRDDRNDAGRGRDGRTRLDAPGGVLINPRRAEPRVAEGSAPDRPQE
jgi:hypothetical protein